MSWNKDKLDELLAALRSREEEKHKNVLLWILAVIGAVAAVLGIGYAVYRFFSPDYLEDFEDDFEDDFDDFFDEEEDAAEVQEEAAADEETADETGDEADDGQAESE